MPLACLAALTLVIASTAARAERPGKAPPRPLLAVDIEAQPLDRALARFDSQTGVSVFFPSELTAGRSSPGVRGRYRAEQALERLLAGTGLVAVGVAHDAFVLRRKGQEAGATAAALPRRPATRGYANLLQERVTHALCADPRLGLGTYRLAMSVRVNADGVVGGVRLLDTTGDAARDAAVLGALKRLDIGQAPADPSRPFVLLVQPRPAGRAQACAGVLHGSRRP